MQSTEQIAQSIESNMNKIAFFGTSHTYGQCNDLPNGIVDKPWVGHLSDSLNTELLNYGLRGATNFDIQVLINEALDAGYLEDVDTVILEPRLYWDSIMVQNKYNSGSLNNTSNNKDNLIGKTRQYLDTVVSPWHYSIALELSIGDFEVHKHFNEKYFCTDDIDFQHRLERKDLNKLVELYTLFVEHTNFMIYKNLEFVRTIQNLCYALGKKFYWINWESSNSINSDVFPLHQTVLNSCLNTDISIKDYMTRIHGVKYLCSCSHWNEEAQPLISEFIYKRLNKE